MLQFDTNHRPALHTGILTNSYSRATRSFSDVRQLLELGMLPLAGLNLEAVVSLPWGNIRVRIRFCLNYGAIDFRQHISATLQIG